MPRCASQGCRRWASAALATAGVALLSACSDGSPGGPSAGANLAIWPMHPIDHRFRGANALGPGDLDGDGSTDYVTNYEFDQRYVVALHPGGGADPRLPWPTVVAHAAPPMPVGIDTENAILADLDGDGSLDVVGAQGWHVTSWWEGQSAGVRIVWAPSRDRVLDPSAWVDGGRIPETIDAGHFLTVQAYDVNGDGALDIVAGGRVHEGNGARASIKWISAPGSPAERRDLSLWSVHEIDPEQWDGHGFVLDDVDQDGDSDIVDANADFDTPEAEETVHWYENPGTGSPEQLGPWPRHEIYRGPEFYAKPQIAVADLDGDGLRDLITSVDDAIYWFRKTGLYPVAFERVVIPRDERTRWPTRPVRVADVDGDGRLDIVGMLTHDGGLIPHDKAAAFWMAYTGDDPGAASWITHPIKWGSGEPMQLLTFGEKWDGAELADVDVDGDLDLVANCEEWWVDGAPELARYVDPRVDPEAVAVVWFENRIGEAPYRFVERAGVIAIEAEHFTADRDGTFWKRASFGGFAGDGYVQDFEAQVEEARAVDATLGLEYELEARGGTYRIWLRRFVPSSWGRRLGGGSSDSAWLLLDGAVVGGVLDEQPGLDAWTWISAPAPIELARGRHVLGLRAREGGWAVDRIVLARDLDTPPAGQGPAETPAGDGGDR